MNSNDVATHKRVEAPTTHLYLVRHGETEYNRNGMVQGRGINAPLNEMGRRQAEALAAHYASHEFNAIYSSTLLRALETARAVAAVHKHAPLVSLNDLEEMSWGSYEGLNVTAKMREDFNQMREEWRQGNLDFALAGGESARDVQQRAVSALDYIVQKHQGQRVMVVAHGRFLRILLATILSDFGITKMEEIQHTNTGVNYLTHVSDGFLPQFLDNTDHLVAL